MKDWSSCWKVKGLLLSFLLSVEVARKIKDTVTLCVVHTRCLFVPLPWHFTHSCMTFSYIYLFCVCVCWGMCKCGACRGETITFGSWFSFIIWVLGPNSGHSLVNNLFPCRYFAGLHALGCLFACLSLVLCFLWNSKAAIRTALSMIPSIPWYYLCLLSTLCSWK